MLLPDAHCRLLLLPTGHALQHSLSLLQHGFYQMASRCFLWTVRQSVRRQERRFLLLLHKSELQGCDEMNIDYPFNFDNTGRTAGASYEQHIRNLIEQVIFTSPGERVNRPDFGSGLMQLVFQPNSSELAAATQFIVQGALQQWLGDLIQVDSVQVEIEDSKLQVIIKYLILRNGQNKVEHFVRG
jgi:phage baseplate assembly protein W